MKFGITGSLNDPENEFPYWVLVDQPFGELETSKRFVGGWRDIDHDARESRAQQMITYLNNSVLAGTYLIQSRGSRYCFSNKDDWENFRTMYAIGWGI